MELECIASLPLRLEVGKEYRDADGRKVTIGTVADSGWSFGGDNGYWYTPTGECPGAPAKWAAPLIALWDSPPLPALQPDSGGWVEWKGGECPVEHELIGSIRRRDSVEVAEGRAMGTFNWRHHGDCKAGSFDIVAYKLPAKAVVHPAPSARTGAAKDPSAVRDELRLRSCGVSLPPPRFDLFPGYAVSKSADVPAGQVLSFGRFTPPDVGAA